MFFVRRINNGEKECFCFETPREVERFLLAKAWSDYEIYFVAAPLVFKDGDNFRIEKALKEAVEGGESSDQWKVDLENGEDGWYYHKRPLG